MLVIMSLALVGFVFFLFLFISPWDNLTLPNSALEGLQDSFEERVNVPLSSVFIKAEPVAGNCYTIDLPEELFRKQDIEIGRTIVTKLGGSGIDAGLDDGDLDLKNDENFFRVAISPEFSFEIFSCSTFNNNFELGGVVELDVVSYSRLLVMKDNYTNNYDVLKNDLRYEIALKLGKLTSSSTISICPIL